MQYFMVEVNVGSGADCLASDPCAVPYWLLVSDLGKFELSVPVLPYLYK